MTQSPAPDNRRPRFTTPALTGLTVTTAVLATTIDQLTKNWALTEFADGHEVELLPMLVLRLVFNPGVAFGMGAELGPPLVVGLFIVVAALIAWITVRVRRRERILGTLALAAAAGGAVGNLIDRVFRADNGPLTGHVVDFIAVNWFAIFNVADIFTTCGIALWAITSVFASGQHGNQRIDAKDVL
jgi:signal peptidase II